MTLPQGTNIPSGVAELADEMTAWRRDFHAHPELGYEEERTSEIVARKLESWGLEVHRGLGRTGVVGVLRGKPGNRAIGLRADMDALAMEEANEGMAHRSRTPNRMHACGHDGHTTMLLGAAKYLSETRRFSGTVNFFFQPAEEGLAGAKAMIDDGLFERFPCDGVYGIHNDPKTELGQISVRAGGMLAAVDYFEVTIRGKGCHGAEPQYGIDPVVASAQVILAIQSIVSRRTNPADPVVISIGQINGGTHNIVIPETVVLRGSVRTLKRETRDAVEGWFRTAVEGAAASQGATAEIDYKRAYPPTINTAAEAEIAARAAVASVGELGVLRHQPSFMAGEDFAFMLERCPGAYAFFGQRAGERHGVALHNPGYDFNDDLLPLGAGYFATLVEQTLPSDSP
jgi:amidohydrolase